jgi:hypothetical protein
MAVRGIFTDDPNSGTLQLPHSTGIPVHCPNLAAGREIPCYGLPDPTATEHDYVLGSLHTEPSIQLGFIKPEEMAHLVQHRKADLLL